MAGIRLGQLLVDARMLSQQALDEVLAFQKVDGRRLGTLLVEKGLVNETQLTQILSHQLSVPWVALLHIEFSRQLLNLVPYEVAERFCLVPIYVRHVRGQGDTLYVAMDDPTNEEPLRECMKYSGLPVRAMIAPPSDIREAIRVCYGIEIDPPHSKAALAKQAAQATQPAQPPQPSQQRPNTDLTPTLQTPNVAPVNESAAPNSVGAPPTPRSGPASARSPESKPTAPRPKPPPPPLPSTRAPSPPSASMRAAPAASDASAAPHPPAPAPSKPRPVEVNSDVPTVEAHEIDIPRRRKIEDPDTEESPAPSQAPVPSTRRPGRSGRLVSLTLLDGTTLTLPSRPAKPPSETLVAGSDDAAGEPSTDSRAAREIFAALRAAANGGDASQAGAGSAPRWEAMFTALLSVLIRKRLITEAELLEELKKL